MKRAERTRNVLVLGSERNKAFAQVLREIKLAPTFVRTLAGVVHALGHMKASAVLVDRNQGAVDDLELVLNVRDLNPEIPIILIGGRREDRADEILSSQQATYLIRKPMNSKSLAADLKGLAKRAGLSNA
jgi:DNA-binding response OmpR family regulator